MQFTSKTLLGVVALSISQMAIAGSIFDNTPFQGVANVVGNATGTNNLQQKLGLPNAGGAVADFFEAAKKNSGPLVTTITTLACPGCVAAAAVVSGPGAAMEAVFTTGLVTAAFDTSPALGIATIVILASDRTSGETGYQQVMIATSDAKPTAKTYDVNADCILKDKLHNTFFAVFKSQPANSGEINPGDTVNLKAPECKAFSDPNNESVTSAKIKKTGASPVGMAAGRFTYVLSGTQL